MKERRTNEKIMSKKMKEKVGQKKKVWKKENLKERKME